jgi:hypothetical protein
MTANDPVARVSPAAFARAPLLMLLLCLCGMAIGLAIDSGSVPLEVLASLCLADSGNLVSGAGMHLELLPATHALMLAGAIMAAAISRFESAGAGSPSPASARYLPDGACIAAMLSGMILGGWLGPPITASLGVEASSTRLVVAMIAGMIAGMSVSMPLYRSRMRREFATRPARVQG